MPSSPCGLWAAEVEEKVVMVKLRFHSAKFSAQSLIFIRGKAQTLLFCECNAHLCYLGSSLVLDLLHLHSKLAQTRVDGSLNPSSVSLSL
eukprot:6288056-Amphidinium_carterae.1